MKRVVCILSLCLALFFVCSPLSVSAAEISAETDNVITFEDGSYITITVEESLSRASYVKTGTKTYTYTDANGNIVWEAVMSCSFLYDGTTSSCTSGVCQVTIYESDWYEISNTTTRSGNTATTELTMGLKGILGITTKRLDYTFTFSCDKDGNLS